jgi:rod shape-determining protein MreC
VYRKQVRRRRAVLALLVVGSFVLLTITYGRGSNGIQRGVGTIFNPVQTAADRALKPARDLVNWFDSTFDARGRNARLHTELESARKQAVGAQAALAENEQLRNLLKLDNSGAIPSGLEPVVGTVISRSSTVWYAAVTIDVGSSDGVEVNDAVVNGDGLVGKVSAVLGGSAQVQSIADGASAVAAKVVPVGNQGLLKPEVGNPGTLILDFLDSTEKIHRGQDVVTAAWRTQGLESRFPANIPIGEISRAAPTELDAKGQVRVRPFADLRNLDKVQVLTGGSRG